jgi:hypothetical protein
MTDSGASHLVEATVQVCLMLHNFCLGLLLFHGSDGPAQINGDELLLSEQILSVLSLQFPASNKVPEL